MVATMSEKAPRIDPYTALMVQPEVTVVQDRAGIPHRLTSETGETVPRSAADMVALAKKATPVAAPGERHVYSSGGSVSTE